MTSDVYREQFNDACFRGGAFPRTDTYAALFRTSTTFVTEEVPAGDYSRQLLTWGSAFRDTSISFQTPGTACFNQEVVFPTQSTAWAPSPTHSLTSIRVYDAATGGEELGSFSITPFSTNVGKQVVIAPNRIKFYYTVEFGASAFRTEVLEYFLKVSATVPTAPTEIGAVVTPTNLAQAQALDAGTYTEITTAGYSRIALSSLDWYHFGGTTPEIYIRNNVTWFTAGAAVGATLAFFDGATLIGYSGTAASFTNSLTVPNGDTVRFVGVEDFGSSMILQHV